MSTKQRKPIWLSQTPIGKRVQRVTGSCWFWLVCAFLWLAGCQEGQLTREDTQPLTPPASPRVSVPTFTPTLPAPASTRSLIADSTAVAGEVQPLTTPEVAPGTQLTQTGSPQSPDTLLFARMNGDLVLYDLNRGQERLLLSGRYGPGNGECQWCVALARPVRPSPDGRWLLVPTADQGTWLVASDGSTQRQISLESLTATWAPDSRRIVFTGERGPAARQDDNEIYLQDLMGNNEAHLLARLPSPVYYPTWSPSCADQPQQEASSCGRHIFAISSCGDQPDGYTCTVWLVDVATGQTKSLGHYAPPGMEVVPANFVWSAQGDEIWVMAAGEWLAFPLTGNSPHSLPTAIVTACHPRVLEQHQTSSGWIVAWQSWDRSLKVTSLAGVTHVLAEDVYFLGTGEELQQKSTEVCPASSVATTDWPLYTSAKYGFTLQYPPGWQYQEVPNAACPMAGNGVWLFPTTEHWCPGNTDARPAVVLAITEVDPSPQWQAQFFDNYQTEPFQLGTVTGRKIQGINKESRSQELAVIANLGGFFLLAVPNHSPASLHFFEIILSTWQMR